MSNGENVKRERCALLRDREAMQSTITDLRNRLNHSEMLHGRYPEDAERPPTNSAPVSSTLVAAPQQEQAAPDTSELYYARMEADRKDAEDAYFAARPQLSDSGHELVYIQLFRAGYERAYQKLWNASPPKEAK